MARVRIFTDGACSENPGPGGWAAVFNTNTECKVIKGNEISTTNNRMELMALVRALEAIKLRGLKNNTYELYSDSAYVVNSINQSWVDVWMRNGFKTTKGYDIKNRDLWIRYYKVRKKLRDYSVTIIKVRGHAGNPFNEYVDKLAKAETEKAKNKILRGEGQHEK